MHQIRASVFETNSSSTHSLTILTPEEWSSFISDPDLLMDRYGNFVSTATAIAEYRRTFCLDDNEEVSIDELYDQGGYYTYSHVNRGRGGVKSLKTPEGHTVVSIYCAE